MEFRLESSVFEEKAIVKSFSRDFRAETFSEETIVFDRSDLSGSVRQLQLDKFCLVIQDLRVPEGYSINICGDSPLFKLHFEVEGDYTYIPTDPKSPVMSIPGGHFNIFYLTKPNGCLNFKSSSRKTLEILFTEEFLKKTIGDNYSELSFNLRTGIEENRPFLLWEESRPIPLELQQHIEEIISCRYCGHIKKIYLEARITALLVNFLVGDDPIPAQEGKELSKVAHKGILRVEEHIRGNFTKTLTIADLAPIAGLNTSKLKQSFKKVYSTTIFKYITRLRMERAKELIVKENLSVSETSYLVGYKNPQHFTVAFKKYYGFLPSSLS